MIRSNNPLNSPPLSSDRLFRFLTMVFALLVCLIVDLRAQVPFVEHVIADSVGQVLTVYAIDIDSDDDMDVLSASNVDGIVHWYENEGAGGFTKHVVSGEADWTGSVFAIDLDGDKDVDVLSASAFGDGSAWYENDGDENFTRHLLSLFSAVVFALDMDEDGDVDVLTITDFLSWLENDGNESFSSHAIGSGCMDFYPIDLDGDNDIDIASISDLLVWHENDGNQNFDAHTITTNISLGTSVHAADVDGDQDIDLLSASLFDSRIAWYQNDGSGNFTQQTITTDAGDALDVFAADVDNDNDVDVLSVASSPSRLALYENDGNENFGYQAIASAPLAASMRAVHSADIDSDNRNDVIVPEDPGFIKWYESGGVVEVTAYQDWLSGDYDISYAFPNPFNPSTSIRFSLPRAGEVSLSIYDLLGEKVTVLVSGYQNAGTHTVQWNATGRPSGVYFYRLNTGEFVETKKLILVR